MHIDLNAHIDNAKARYHLFRQELAWRSRDFIKPGFSYNRTIIWEFLVAHHRIILFVLGLAAGYWMIGPALFGG
jgi:hypothetical protein